jgi:ABC-type transport system substrate-binding protein
VALGATLEVPLRTDLKGLNPVSFVGAGQIEVGIHLHEGLVRLHPETFEVISGIAKDWSWDSEQNKILFELKRNVQFHASSDFGNQSRSVTASHVVESFKNAALAMDQQRFGALMGNRIVGASAFREGSAQDIAGLKMIDDYRLSIELIEQDPSLLYLLAQPEFGVVPSKEFAEKGIGVGPFQLSDQGNETVLTRNKDYHSSDEFGNQLPYLDTLIFVKVATNEEMLNKLLDGQIDIVSDLELSPVRFILDRNMELFSGENPEFIMVRDSEVASYDIYTIYRSGISGLGSGFMGYLDYTRVEIEQ